MSGAQADAVQLISGLLGHVRQIVGDGASYAMLHYGAVEEGKRLAATAPPGDFARVLERLDDVLGHRSEVVKDDGSTVTVRIERSALLGQGQRSMQGIVLGLLEGALSGARHGRFKGEALPGDASDALLVELRRDE